MHIDINEYDFTFPTELIAQRAVPKGQSKILVLSKTADTKEIVPAHCILEKLEKGDCLVVNNTKVIPARLYGQKETGGKFEVLLVRPRGDFEGLCWEVWVKPGKFFKQGAQRIIGGIVTEVKAVNEDGSRVLAFLSGHQDFENMLDAFGKVPLPPYIDRKADSTDETSYQTVFAKHRGAVAAPTASLHFSEEMMDSLKEKGVEVAELTLHVGPGTFKPVEVENALDHPMHGENYFLEQKEADKINRVKKAGGRIIAVGTTSTRVLETIADENGFLQEAAGLTHKYIYPGYRWKVVDGLVTNFHFPKTTLLLLVASLLGKKELLEAYDFAIKNKMRLFSYGDGMLIV